MQIIRYRGFWQNTNDINSIFSLEKFLKYNFGVETDIRDFCDKIIYVINNYDYFKNNSIKYGKKFDCNYILEIV